MSRRKKCIFLTEDGVPAARGTSTVDGPVAVDPGPITRHQSFMVHSITQ